MAKLEIKIGDKLHRVVYIDYKDGIPHSVITVSLIPTSEKPYWRLYYWDFFANDGDTQDIRAYNSGSGGSLKDIQAPQWADGHIGKYWVSDDVKFHSKPKNGIRLKNPIPISSDYFSKKSINPFKVAEVTSNMEYCDRCEHYSTEFCTLHKYDDNEGNARYIDDNSYAD